MPVATLRKLFSHMPSLDLELHGKMQFSLFHMDNIYCIYIDDVRSYPEM